MHCPFCRHGDTKVIDSRGTQEEAIRRRRQCLECDRRFTTYERIEETPLRVIKRDDRVVPFDRGTLRTGLQKAVKKRPVSDSEVEKVVEAIEKEVYDTYERTIPSVEIGEMVMAHLRELDEVAYVRFASVYANFTDAAEFAEFAGDIRRTDDAEKPAPRRTPDDTRQPV